MLKHHIYLLKTDEGKTDGKLVGMEVEITFGETVGTLEGNKLGAEDGLNEGA